MNKRIKSILKCYASGMGIKDTSDTFHASRNTVRKYVRLFLSSGKSIDQLLSLSDEQLHELFGSGDSRRREPSSRRVELEDLIKGCEDAILYFEGAPAAIVPDNRKAAVTRSDRNDPSSMTISPLLPNITAARCSPFAKIIYFFSKLAFNN